MRVESASGSTGTDQLSGEFQARDVVTDIYSRLGVTPVINGIGNKTALGGSTPSARAKRAMDDADAYYCSMPELMERSGERVAELLGVEAAFITSGCASAIVHAAAGVMAGSEKEGLGRLPDTTGMKREFIFQHKQRYFYDRCYVVPGGTLIVVGDEKGCTAREMEEAIGPDTAGIGYVDKTRGTEDDSIVSITEAMDIGRGRDVPVIVDAAYQAYPVDRMRWISGAADLVCFGGKYFGAPSSTGFLCGRSELVHDASRQGFVASQSGDRPRSIGRSMKVDRQEIVGMVVALEEWLTMDHEGRILGLMSKARIIRRGVEDIAGVSTDVDRLESHAAAALTVALDPKVISVSGHAVADELASGTPSILVVHEETSISIALHTLHDGQPEVIAERLRTALR